MTAKKYTKKPVQIEALLYTGGTESALEVMKWMSDGHQDVEVRDEDKIIIETLEGDITASPGDYIIKGVHGEFYPCKPDIFSLTYDEVVAS